MVEVVVVDGIVGGIELGAILNNDWSKVEAVFVEVDGGAAV